MTHQHLSNLLEKLAWPDRRVPNGGKSCVIFRKELRLLRDLQAKFTIALTKRAKQNGFVRSLLLFYLTHESYERFAAQDRLLLRHPEEAVTLRHEAISLF